MEEVPEHIMEQARRVVHRQGYTAVSSRVLPVAEALLAAEKRGREGERERACKILIGIADEIAKQALNKIEAQLGKSIASCAAIIRAGQ